MSQWIRLFFLGLLTFVAFLPSLDNGFVATWDDGPNLLENPHLRGFGWPSFSWACRTFLLGVYQPLAWLLYFAEAAAWGLEPWGYHLVSLLWHAVNAILFFVLTQRLLERARPDLAAPDRSFGARLPQHYSRSTRSASRSSPGRRASRTCLAPPSASSRFSCISVPPPRATAATASDSCSRAGPSS